VHSGENQQHNTTDFWEKKVPEMPGFKEIILTSSYLDKWVLGGRQNTAGNLRKKTFHSSQ
jgi:hypothetical protein